MASMEHQGVEVQVEPDPIFTRFVQALDEDSEAVESLFEETWKTLGEVLSALLRRRSLWSASPNLVGLYGHDHWGEDALQELIQDVYTELFLRQLPYLLSRCQKGHAVEALVRFLAGNFLTARQKQHDPLGYRLFEILRAALGEAVEEKELHILRARQIRGRPAIRNDTIFSSDPSAHPSAAAQQETLRSIAERWNDELLPDLITAGDQGRRLVVARLRRLLFDLEAEGIRVFQFKHLIDALKMDVRARWAALYAQDEGEVEASEKYEEGEAPMHRPLFRVFRPSHPLEEQQSFAGLIGCVADWIDRIREPVRTRRYMGTLWTFLRRFALDDALQRLPSHRKLSRALRIPRERLPQLFEQLGELVHRCQGTFTGTLTQFDPQRRPSSGGHHE